MALRKQYADYAARQGNRYNLVDSGWSAGWIPGLMTLPFTRNLTGPMGFTPVTFSGVRPNSDAAELALGVLSESGVQHFAGRISSYTAYPVAEQFLRVVPAAWDETRLVAGDPGKLAVPARRSGATWFLGAGVAGDPRDLSVGTGFPGSGDWLVELYHDSPTGRIAFDAKRVSAGDSLTVPVAHNGGYAARLCQAPPATTCG